MASKFLQSVGVLALLGLVGGSLAALLIVKDRIHLTVEAEELAARRGPDPLAVIDSDIGATRDEVRALGEGVGQRFQMLHDALETRAAERETAALNAIASVRAELIALRSQVGTDAHASTLANAELAAVLARLAARADGPAAAVVDVATPAAIPEVAATTDVAPQAEIVPAVTTPEPVATKPATKGFLSFQLPSQAFAFDRLQRYSILPNLSRVGFDAKRTLHDFSGVTTSVEGEITANLARPSEGCGGSVRAKTVSLDTGLEARDESMREILEPALHPELRFDWSSFESTSVDVAAQKVAGLAKGRLTIHGVSRDIAIAVSVTVDGSKRITIDGQTQIKLSDFGVKPPSKLGLISVADEATLWIALRARTLGAAVEAAR